MEGHLAQHDAEIEGHQTGGNRNPQQFFQNQGRNVHAAGGGAAPDHDAQAHTQTHAREQHVQQLVVGDQNVAQSPVQHFQSDGVEQGADHRGHGELPTQDPPAKGQHHNVEHKDETGNGNTRQLIHHQGNTGGTAADQIGRQHEQLDGQGIYAVAENHQQQ